MFKKYDGPINSLFKHVLKWRLNPPFVDLQLIINVLFLFNDVRLQGTYIEINGLNVVLQKNIKLLNNTKINTIVVSVCNIKVIDFD